MLDGTENTIDWLPRSVSADGRTLHIAGHLIGWRALGRPTLSAVENLESIQVHLQLAHPKPEAWYEPDIERFAAMEVCLARPLAGRRIEGPGCLLAESARLPVLPDLDPENRHAAIPNVVGMAAEDAVKVLRAHGLHAVWRSAGATRVTRHDPPGGALISREELDAGYDVTLTA